MRGCLRSHQPLAAVCAKTLAPLLLFLLAPEAASAFDCAKAKSADEKAICASSEAKAADDAMTSAYLALRKNAAGADRSALDAAQTRWLGRRGQNCSDDNGDAFTGAKLSACLADASNARAAFLNGAPEAGPGAPSPMAPVFRIEKGRKGRADIDFQLVKFVQAASPGERAFNAAADKLYQDIEQPDAADANSDTYAFQTSLAIAYASDRLVSGKVDAYSDSGGAHPNSYIAHINVDLSAGTLLSFADLADAKATKAINAKCVELVKAQRKDKMGADSQDDPFTQDMATDVAKSTDDLGAWGFGVDAATVDYSPYSVGSYAEGYYDCKLPYAFLRPLIKGSFPLP
jgi:uncharacterized protein YecT (DUF1311 family)